MNLFADLKKKTDPVIIMSVLFLFIVSVVMIGSTHISTGFIARDTIIQTASLFQNTTIQL